MLRYKRKILLPNNTLKIGDIVFMDDRSKFNLAAKYIRYVELGGKNPGKNFVPNHIAEIRDENPNLNEIMLAQADYSGVKPKKLSIWLNNPNVNIIVKRYNRPLTENEKYILRTWVIQQEGRGYDWTALLGIYLEYLLVKYSKSEWLKKIIKSLKNPFNIEKRFICSEYIFLSYLQIKISLYKHAQAANITPYDIFQNKRLKDVYSNTNYSYTKEKSIK